MIKQILTGIWHLGVLAALTTVVPLAASAQSSVTLAWNASAGGTIAGYRLYLGVASDTYGTMVDVGNTTTATVPSLSPGMTYYFAVTAYDITGLESTFSGEVSYAVPPSPSDLANLGLSFTETGDALLTGTAPAGYAYDVLASPNLSSWTIIGSVVTDTTGLFQFTDPNAPTNSARYYRLHQTLP
jgi:hypothetical protein